MCVRGFWGEGVCVRTLDGPPSPHLPVVENPPALVIPVMYVGQVKPTSSDARTNNNNNITRNVIIIYSYTFLLSNEHYARATIFELILGMHNTTYIYVLHSSAGCTDNIIIAAYHSAWGIIVLIITLHRGYTWLPVPPIGSSVMATPHRTVTCFKIGNIINTNVLPPARLCRTTTMFLWWWGGGRRIAARRFFV